MTTPRDQFEQLVAPDLRELLTRVDVPTDAVIEADKDAQLTIVDADTHRWRQRPDDPYLHAVLASIEPQPDAAWISHGGGLKLLFAGPQHDRRALAAALSIPRDFSIEILKHTRHPRSVSSKHPGTSCSEVIFNPDAANQPFHFHLAGPLTREDRERALSRMQVEDGKRYDHKRCPIDGPSDSDATACVVVLDGGVYCHRCAGKGICSPGSSTPGFYSFCRVLDSPTTVLDELARDWVHWPHARLVLRDAFPNLGDRLLREAYRLTLIDRYREDDPRITMALQEAPRVVWGEGIWLDADTLRPTELDDDAVSGLPGCHDMDKDGELKLNRVRRSEFKKRTPPGYRPIRPYRGISFAPPDNTIAIRLPAKSPPIELLADPIPLDEALSALEHDFPRLNATYLQATLAAVICAESRGGQPPMVACTGPSGSGKEQHLRLAASFVGEDIVKIPLNENDEAFNRQVGSALAAGNRFLVVDELGKIRNLNSRLPQLLAISANIQWRPLYENRSVTTPFRGVLCFPSVRLPDFLRCSDEFRRRVHEVRLHQRLLNWMKSSGGDTTEWRHRHAENARVANSILTHVWRLCREHGFLFERVAEVMGLNPLQPADQAIGDEQYRALYRHCRNEDGQRKLIEDATFVRGWVDLDSPGAKTLIAPLLPETDANDPRKALNILRANLEAVSWNDVLGIENPPIRLEIKIHGTRRGMRFIADEPAMKGHERINEQLPASPINDGVTAPPAPSADQEPPPPPEPPAAEVITPATPTNPDDAADVLAKAGLPL